MTPGQRLRDRRLRCQRCRELSTGSINGIPFCNKPACIEYVMAEAGAVMKLRTEQFRAAKAEYLDPQQEEHL